MKRHNSRLRASSEKLEGVFHRVTDALYAHKPQSLPPLKDLRNCRLIAHRGEHDNQAVFENTLAAFDAACQRGVWGIECDVRWTRDGVPVIFHDVTLARLHNSCLAVDEIDYRSLRQEFPRIPSLEVLIDRYGKRCHLMIELKGEGVGPWRKRHDTLKRILQPLSPGEDFHLMSFFPRLLEKLHLFPRHAFLPIARTNSTQIIQTCLRRGYGGFCGHYLLVNGQHIRRLDQKGLAVGTGFANSINTLHREVKRGVTWIFSERAVALQRYIRQAN